MNYLLPVASLVIMIPVWMMAIKAAYSAGASVKELELYFIVAPLAAFFLVNKVVGYIQDNLMEKSEVAGVTIHGFKPGQSGVRAVYMTLHAMVGAAVAAMLALGAFVLSLK